MLMPPLLLALAFAAAAAAAQSHIVKSSPSEPSSRICYDRVGCFDNGGHFFDPLKRPVSRLPQSPEQVATTFYLFTRANRQRGQKLDYTDDATLSQSQFSAKRLTKFITHGFTDSIESGWMLEMKDVLLQYGDYNVVVIDWSGGNFFPYSQAVANTRLAGAVLANTMLWLERRGGATRSSFHLIGHSLGSHIAGYAGSRLEGGVGRITALDAAGPYFSGTHPSVRLDPSDAEFVDAIHTDGESIFKGGFGMYDPVGHVDFYPNGGKNQPGCTRNPIVSIVEAGSVLSITCNHVRVMPLLIGTIKNQFGNYRAVKCDSYDSFKAGRCTCSNSECTWMGMKADSWRPKGRTNVKMFIDTSAEEPFDVNHYRISMKLSPALGSEVQLGKIFIEILGAGGTRTGLMQLTSVKYLSPGSEYTAVLTSKQPVTDVTAIRIQWINYKPTMNQRMLFVHEAKVLQWRSGVVTRYCTKNIGIENGIPKEFKAGFNC